MSEKNEWKLVPVDRSYDMRVKALIAFNTAEQSGKDRDDALDAAFQAMLATAPCATCNDQGAVGNILNAEPCPVCTPPASAQDESQREGHPHDDPRFVALCREHDILGTAMQGLAAVFWREGGSPAPSAPGDAQDEPVPEWAACESRRPWVTNSLKANAQELRDKEKRCRRAFNKDFMGVPSRYVADAYAEAAAVFEAKLAALAAQVPQQGEA